MRLLEFTCHDFRRTYVGTYVYQPDLGKVFQIEDPRLDDSATVQTFRARDVSTDTSINIEASAADSLIDTPISGYVQYNHNAYYVKRYPERQWRRGTRREKLRFITGSGITVSADSVSEDFLLCAFSPRYGTLREHIEKVRELSVAESDNIWGEPDEVRIETALDRNFAMFGNLLWFRGTQCGHLAGDSVVLDAGMGRYLEPFWRKHVIA